MKRVWCVDCDRPLSQNESGEWLDDLSYMPERCVDGDLGFGKHVPRHPTPEELREESLFEARTVRGR